MADTTTKNNNTDDFVPSGETALSVDLIRGKSKNGNDYIALETRVGEYRTLAFPTKIEQMYIKHVLDNN